MDPNWLTGIGTLILAMATFVLAGIAYWSIRKSNEANKLLREETSRLQKQERERLRKLQAVDFISEWADEANNIIGDKMFSLQSVGPINEFLNRTGSIRTNVEAIMSASRLFDDIFQAVVTEALNRFSEFIKTVFALRDSYLQNTVKDTSDLQKKLIDARITALNGFLTLQAYVRKHRISFLI